jgi:hypothetical protein
MKYFRFLIAFSLLFMSQSLLAQRATQVLASGSPVTWLGLDFSKVNFKGDPKFKKSYMAPFLVDELNELMITEAEKFNVGEMLGKTAVVTKINITMDHNSTLDLPALVADSLGQDYRLTGDDITEIVSSYDFKGNRGIGLMFNIETLNKKTQQGVVWVTFLDMGTKEVIVSERLMAEAGGSGIRNFWAGSIYHMMVEVRKTELKKWRAKYSTK